MPQWTGLLVAGVAAAMLGVVTPRGWAQQHEAGEKAMQQKGFAIPSALREEHREIHGRLEAAARLQGKTGDAARTLARILHPHFEREEQIALPPLGLLQQLADGKYTPGMAAVLPMTDSLRAELPRMLEEHEAIGAATRGLQEAATAEGQKDAASLAAALLLHAQNEEQVLYPAAVLVGDVVRGKAGSVDRLREDNGTP